MQQPKEWGGQDNYELKFESEENYDNGDEKYHNSNEENNNNSASRDNLNVSMDSKKVSSQHIKKVKSIVIKFGHLNT